MQQAYLQLRAGLNRMLGYPRIRHQRGKLPPDSMLVASFPKSGTTALRFTWWVLAHLLDGREPPLSWRRMNDVLPQLPNWRRDRGLDFDQWDGSNLPLLAATHEPMITPYEGMRTILVMRDPVDCMTSWHRYRSANKQDRFEGDLGMLVDDPRLGIRSWIRHTKAWLGSAGCTIRFEQLMQDPTATMSEAFRAFDLDIPSQMIRKATALSMEDGIARAEQDSEISERFDDSFKFARSKESRAAARTTDPAIIGRIHDAVHDAGLGFLIENPAS